VEGIGIAILAQNVVGFDRTRRASLLSVALAIAVAMFYIYLTVL
jgi:hypothetical protein